MTYIKNKLIAQQIMYELCKAKTIAKAFLSIVLYSKA
jgi:hypothetical protein